MSPIVEVTFGEGEGGGFSAMETKNLEVAINKVFKGSTFHLPDAPLP